MTRLTSICTRLLLYGFTFFVGVCLAVSAVCSTPSERQPVWIGRWEALTAQAWSGRWETGGDRQYLIDRSQGRPSLMALPQDYRWGLLSVSPWTDGGAREAVSACYRPPGHGTGAFWGLARIGLPEGRVLQEVELDVLPKGRPCWLPERPGTVLFVAGDGRLYCHDFAPRQSRIQDLAPAVDSSRGDEPARAVTWEGRDFEEGIPYVIDPSWPADRRLRHLLVGAVIPRNGHDHRTMADRTFLCWFQIDPDGTVITAAGLMLDPNGGPREGPAVTARFPVLAAGPGDEIHLVYLARTSGQRTARLESIPIVLDAATRQPRIAPGARAVVLDTNAAIAPPIVADDGTVVFYLSGASGQPASRSVEGLGVTAQRPGLALVGGRR
jgi:hypothetical protein